MKWLGIVLALIGGTPVLYSVAYPSLTLRYRLTLEAEVDGKPKTGSGVIEVIYSKQPEFASGRDRVSSHRGEAVVLDLGDRGILFALLKAGSDSRSIPESIILRAFNFDGGAFPGPTVEEGFKKLRQLSGKRELPLTSLPLLVRFRDLNDPMTVEKVDPFDISKSFGGGARLVRATLEIVPEGVWPLNSFGVTDEPIVKGIDQKLPWLKSLQGKYLHGGGSARGAPLELDSGDFATTDR
ncbi:hypothetical protein IVB22_03450 [Bradyrhizobium sp. 190]|uniref:hypothetical protein n=1 Tax=Bradyrhizobium sp. 190 TaxID=2782658 RepID=UPI001FFB9CDE|nr:hypothetical protein [Bradyrhizobium sp. 190]MCK1511642.1 hypothetical protein [Bradyrhizobium sp. 190]